MRRLPLDVRRYRQTPVLTEDTIPVGMLADHVTGDGVWGLITVLEGTLRFHCDGAEADLKPGKDGVIEPGVPHSIEPVGPVRFRVGFYR